MGLVDVEVRLQLQRIDKELKSFGGDGLSTIEPFNFKATARDFASSDGFNTLGSDEKSHRSRSMSQASARTPRSPRSQSGASGMSRNPSNHSNTSENGENFLPSKPRTNAYESVFRKKVVDKMTESKHATASLSLADFEEIKWPMEFPHIILDILEYLTEIDVEDIITQRRKKAQDDKWRKKFADEARLERERNPDSRVTEKDLLDKYFKENRDKEDEELDQLINVIGED